MKKSNKIIENTLLISSLLMFIYSFIGYVFLPPGTLAPPLKASFNSNTLAIISHAVFSSIAILSGVIQLRRSFRNKYPLLNLLFRKVYFVSVLFGGVTGLYLAFFAYAGFANVVGFFLLAVLWLLTTFKAYIAQKKDDIETYKIWIVRSFALTFSAVTLRIYMGMFFIIFGYRQFDYFYATLGFLCWIPNILIIEWLYLLPKFKKRTVKK